jgi:hypothetical protein
MEKEWKDMTADEKVDRLNAMLDSILDQQNALNHKLFRRIEALEAKASQSEKDR